MNICKYCDGSGEGYSDGQICAKCHGQGTTEATEDYQLSIETLRQLDLF